MLLQRGEAAALRRRQRASRGVKAVGRGDHVRLACMRGHVRVGVGAGRREEGLKGGLKRLFGPWQLGDAGCDARRIQPPAPVALGWR